MVATVVIVSIVEVSSPLLKTDYTVANAASTELGDNPLAKNVLTTYSWNLHDIDLPLMRLPEQLSGNIDLSITYSLDQFQFPLFQTLHFNSRAGKYVLMVMTKKSLRTDFIVLDPVNARDLFQARGNSKLSLMDQGDFKVLTASDGTTYTFEEFPDGELHCSRINGGNDVVINIEYTSASSIETITDDTGRTINFKYTDQYLSAVTQTWGAAESKLKQTWEIADRSIVTHRPAVGAMFTRMEIAKRIPTNAITPSYTEEMAASDSTLAAIFGGPGAVAAANGFEPGRLGRQYPLYRGDLVADDGRILRGHLSYAMHLYGSDDGTGETDLYVPAGFISHSSTPTPTDAAITFYYPQLGNFADVTLAVFHVADFQLSVEGALVRIGHIGGRGGSIGTYKHSHLEFYRGDTGLPLAADRGGLRIDPATVFGTRIPKQIGSVSP
jgi:hypothetical protein